MKNFINYICKDQVRIIFTFIATAMMVFVPVSEYLRGGEFNYISLIFTVPWAVMMVMFYLNYKGLWK